MQRRICNGADPDRAPEGRKMNNELLLDRIKQSGLKRERIASELNVSGETLRRKLAGLSEFTASEIGLLCSLLGFTPEDAAAIFYPSMLN